MITICPKCALTLTVSAADLRIAQGQVRCGRCLAVFNALLALYDEPPGRRSSSRADRSDRGAGSAARSDNADARNVTAPQPAIAETSAAIVPDEPVSEDTSPSAGVEAGLAPAAAAPAAAAPAAAAPEAAPPSSDAADSPSEIIARDIIAAGFVEEPISATDDTGVNPVLSDIEPAEPPPPDPAATDVNVQLTADAAATDAAPTDATPADATATEAAEASLDEATEPEPVAAPDDIPPAANEELIEDLPAANDPFIADPDAAANDPEMPAEASVPETEPETLAETIAEAAADATAEDHALQQAATAATPAAATEGIDLSLPDDDFGTVRVIVPASVAAEASVPDVEPLFQRSAGRSPEPDAELELVETAPDAPDTPEDAAAEELAIPAPRRRSALWAAAAAICGVLIAAQLVHLNRDALALNPSLGPTIHALYARLGMPIAPHWEITAYDVRQQGAVGAADATAPLTVRASIVNRAARAQPMPLLRVTLQDRFGNRIALRDLQPREYLPGTKAGGKADAKTLANLAPGQRVDAEVAMADPGGKAVGFEIDACLQVAPARYSCANDPTVDHGTTSAAR